MAQGYYAHLARSPSLIDVAMRLGELRRQRQYRLGDLLMISEAT